MLCVQRTGHTHTHTLTGHTHTRTRAHTHARTHAHARTRTHAHKSKQETTLALLFVLRRKRSKTYDHKVFLTSEHRPFTSVRDAFRKCVHLVLFFWNLKHSERTAHAHKRTLTHRFSETRGGGHRHTLQHMHVLICFAMEMIHLHCLLIIHTHNGCSSFSFTTSPFRLFIVFQAAGVSLCACSHAGRAGVTARFGLCA